MTNSYDKKRTQASAGAVPRIPTSETRSRDAHVRWILMVPSTQGADAARVRVQYVLLTFCHLSI